MGNDLEPTSPRDLAIREISGRGRGVVTRRTFRAGEILEMAPVIVVPRHQLEPLRGSVMDDYWFWWDAEHNACGLGWASIYNHGCPANAVFRCEVAARVIVVTAVIDIEPGVEVTINYHGDVADPRPVWFPIA